MLRVEELYVNYGKVPVLHGVTLHIPQGQIVTLIGANGAGKTTTLRAISGMISPVAGSIFLKDVDVTGLPAHLMTRQGVAHSPEGRRVFPDLSVEDNLILGAFTRLTNQRPQGHVAQDRDRMFHLFPRLAERRRQKAGTLSGGEQQMLAMARALMSNPEILLLDEPSMGLAPRLVEQIFEIIIQLKKEQITMLLVEQFAATALSVADYGYILENGHLIASGTPRALQNDPRLQKAYLGASLH